MSGLPRGWTLSSLGDVVEVRDNEREPINSTERTERLAGKSQAELFPYYGATGQVGWIDGFRSEGEQVLLGEDGAPFLDPTRDKAYIANGRYWVNNHAHILRGVEGVMDNRLLAFQLNATDYQLFVTGSTRLKLTSAAMKQIPLLVPPRAEQTRIVEKLEALLANLDAGVAELKAAQRKLVQYRQSLLKAAMDGALTAGWRAAHTPEGRSSTAEGWSSGEHLLQRILQERRARFVQKHGSKKKYREPVAPDVSQLPELPDGWVWASVEQLAELVSGHTPKDAGQFAADDAEVHWFKVGDMNTEGNEQILVAASTRFLRETADELGLKAMPVGTIVFPKRGGAIATNKKRRLGVEGAYDLNMMGLVPVPIAADWLWSWFTGIDLAKLADGSNVPQINNPDIAPLCVPLPPLEEQHAILAHLDADLAACKQQEQAIAHGLKLAAAQRRNLLRAAFAGQLVPQDPNDEPASELLTRIRAERAGSTGKAGSRTRRRGQLTSTNT